MHNEAVSSARLEEKPHPRRALIKQNVMLIIVTVIKPLSSFPTWQRA